MSLGRTRVSSIRYRCLFAFSQLMREVIVRFVDTGGIVDHDYLNCLFLVNDFNIVQVFKRYIYCWVEYVFLHMFGLYINVI
jgi:hypothetical protein